MPIPPIQIPTDTSVKYGGIFRQMLARTIQKSIDDVKAHRYTVPDDVRLQAWHVLRLLFDGNEFWAETSELLIELSPRMILTGHWSTWIPYLEKGIELSCKKNNYTVMSYLNAALGQIWRRQGLWEDAKEVLQSLLELHEPDLEPEDIALIQNELALLYLDQREYVNAEKLAQMSLDLLDQDQAESANCYFCLGSIYHEKRQWAKAQTLFLKALHIRKKENNHPKIANILVRVAMAEKMHGQYVDAQNLLNEAINIFMKFEITSSAAIAQMELGIVFSLAGNSHKAIQMYMKAKKVFQVLSDDVNLAAVHQNLGVDYHELGELELAEQAFRASIRLNSRLELTSRIINSSIDLALLYEDMGKNYNANKSVQDARQLLSQISLDPSYPHLYSNLRVAADKLNIQL